MRSVTLFGGIWWVAFAAVGVAHGECPVILPTVLVGNPGNAADPTTGFGAVAYSYSIGAYEVTNAQYAAFLNAVAATDSSGLYNENMDEFPFGGITRSGSSGSYTYATISGMADKPVSWVNFWDAVRFANWLHNGQPKGTQNNSTTEDGAYTLTTSGIANNTVVRNPNWQWAVTSEDEWYKAAYHQPVGQGGDFDNYWLYPSSSNLIDTTDANYCDAVGQTTTAGSYPANFYGAFDLAGNVWEWNEAIIKNVQGTYRGLRGGSFSGGGCQSTLMASFRTYGFPVEDELPYYGFRVSRIGGRGVACSGDLNGDNAVNTSDLTQFLGLFGTTVPTGSPGDLNCDGAVNTSDLTTFLGRFGSAC